MLVLFWRWLADDALAQAPLAQAAGTADVLVQYGLPTGFLLLTIGAIKILFTGQSKTLEREVARADRAEQQVRELEKSVREQTVPALLQSATTMAEVIKLLEKRAQQ